MTDFVKVSKYEYLMITYCAAYLGWRTLWDIFVAFLLHRHHPGRIENE